MTTIPRHTDLTEILIPDDGQGTLQEDHGTTDQVIFRNHLRALTGILEEAARDGATCFGAIAWLTDRRILRALTHIPTAMLIQKEDFLRPEAGAQEGWQEELRKAYEAILEPCESRYGLPGIAKGLSVSGDPGLEAVRCVGERPEPGRDNPRMHNKFLVFAHRKENKKEGFYSEIEWSPYAVWTGSANLTDTTDRSWENSLFIGSEKIAQAYLDEWVQLFTMSEPLDWQSPYVDPEWRIGT